MTQEQKTLHKKNENDNGNTFCAINQFRFRKTSTEPQNDPQNLRYLKDLIV